jgi:hypothetical protein
MADDARDLDQAKITVKGRSVEARSLLLDGKAIIITGRLAKTARMREEWYEDLDDPESVVKQLKGLKPLADIFTFWQRLPEREARFAYYMEWDNVAALPISSFAQWWKKQINSKTRNLVRRAEKKGVLVKEVVFNDNFVSGITEIFNETPVRQGKPFWHYQKSFEKVKEEMSDRLDKADFIGAYLNNELIGFIKLLDAGKYYDMVEILSKIEHRDKSPTNALLAKAVEICERKNSPFLVYANWTRGSLGDFKKHNGFRRIDLPRYYVPLTTKGKMFLRMRLHHGISGLVPEKVKISLISMRAKWYSRNEKLTNQNP